MEIYLDNAATTKIDEDVLEVYIRTARDAYGNASSMHTCARKAKQALETAREQLAEAIHAWPDEIYFTSGATESNNWAIYCANDACKQRPYTMVTTAVEHHAVLEPLKALEKKGMHLIILDVDITGQLFLPKLKESIASPNTALLSVMGVNNETGTIYPIKEIGEIAAKKNIPLHCDAVSALGKIPLDVKTMQVSYMTLSAHKINGPLGVGALYAKRSAHLVPFLRGGAQEKGLRSGTYNVPAIAAFGFAAQKAIQTMQQNNLKIQAVSNAFLKRIQQCIPSIKHNAKGIHQVPHILNFTIPHIDQQALLFYMDSKGIACAAGSACSAGDLTLSHVIRAIDKSLDEHSATIRFSFSKDNTIEQAIYAAETFAQGIKTLSKDPK